MTQLVLLLAFALALSLGATGLGILVAAKPAVQRFDQAGVPDEVRATFGVAALLAAGGLVVGPFLGAEILAVAAGMSMLWFTVIGSYEVGSRGRPAAAAVVHGAVSALLLLLALRAWLQPE